jgi:hypothetical protein
LSPGGLLLLQLYPLPNTVPGAGGCTNWVDSLPTRITWRQDNVRLDYSLDERTRLMVRATQDGWANSAPNATSANGLWGDDPFPAVESAWKQPGRSMVAQLTRSLGSEESIPCASPIPRTASTSRRKAKIPSWERRSTRPYRRSSRRR